MASSARTGNNQLDALDGLRGIAAATVLAHHAGLKVGPTVLIHGYLSVDLFFMISGFVIARAYEPRLRTTMTVGEFLVVRLIRLYPLIALGIILGFGEALLGISADKRPMILLFAQLCFVPVLWRSGDLFPLNGVQWSLWFELFVNAVHAVIASKLTNWKLAAIVIVGGFALCWTSGHFGGLGVGWSRTNFVGGFARVIFAYGSGVLLFRAHDRGYLRRLSVPWPLLAIALPLLVIAAWPIGFKRASYVDPLIVMLGFPTLVICGVNAKVPRIVGQASRWLGAVSYPTYALQGSVTRLIKYLVSPLALGLGGRALLWGGASLITILFASLVLRFYDEPLRGRLRQITTRRLTLVDAALPTSGKSESARL